MENTQGRNVISSTQWVKLIKEFLSTPAISQERKEAEKKFADVLWHVDPGLHDQAGTRVIFWKPKYHNENGDNGLHKTLVVNGMIRAECCVDPWGDGKEFWLRVYDTQQSDDDFVGRKNRLRQEAEEYEKERRELAHDLTQAPFFLDNSPPETFGEWIYDEGEVGGIFRRPPVYRRVSARGATALARKLSIGG